MWPQVCASSTAEGQDVGYAVQRRESDSNGCRAQVANARGVRDLLERRAVARELNAFDVLMALRFRRAKADRVLPELGSTT